MDVPTPSVPATPTTGRALTLIRKLVEEHLENTLGLKDFYLIMKLVKSVLENKCLYFKMYYFFLRLNLHCSERSESELDD